MDEDIRYEDMTKDQKIDYLEDEIEKLTAKNAALKDELYYEKNVNLGGRVEK